jgi:hypothetical protein
MQKVLYTKQGRKLLWAAAIVGPIKQGTREVCGVLWLFLHDTFFLVMASMVTYLYAISFCLLIPLEGEVLPKALLTNFFCTGDYMYEILVYTL